NDDSDDFLMDYDNRSILQDAFDALPEDMKKIIQMSFYEDFSQREIAEIMGVSQMQISRLIKRALLLMYESIVKRI
ncbi:MAG: sigma-70 family RNA polymerase sigma factor, partial [Alphaproteobacteria bacterium]|nr:sigma-70 family RNA polymerase sigma factor [Alphaproteobacteria bacterium]